MDSCPFPAVVVGLGGERAALRLAEMALAAKGLALALCAGMVAGLGRGTPTMRSRVTAHTMRLRSATPRMAAPEYIFELDREKELIRFGCRQKSVTMVRPESGGSLHDFIASSANAIVMSSWDSGQVRPCEGVENEYLIDVEEFDFVALRFAVELRARCTLDERTNTARLESMGFRLIGPGLERVEEAIDVQVVGALTPSKPDARICALSGDVQFIARGKLPAVLRSAPEPALRVAANTMSKALIAAASERFSQKVPKAYSEWARKR